jgi:EAL domain-containing protein (putative c-di-GMP-specific phosphodiesterase class I)
MPSLDKWVIENTFKYMSTLKKGDSFGIDLCAINLSGTTLSDDKFIDYMHKLLDTYKLPPELICFEITETAAITNITKAMNFISRFKDIGFRFSLDDFGAGLSSYSYLKNLPVDFIKIDGSFVSGIANDPLNRSIVESITQVGHTMGIQIIAEWVDSEGVLKILTEIGVDYAQGFSIDKPAPLVKN